jgi:catechol 2,3-dioxygenase-like lactoylglutathione lyase family enzyme
MRIDHVIYATRDLDTAAQKVERELGLEVHAGGRHAGGGTHNRIVPLGGGWLELGAIADADEAAGSTFGKALLEFLDSEGEGLMAWVVEVDDVEPVAARLGTEVTTVERPGVKVKVTGIKEAMQERFLPFFLSREEGGDPGAGQDAGGISWLEVSGDAARLAEWLGGAELPVRVVDGAPGVTAMGIGSREWR